MKRFALVGLVLLPLLGFAHEGHGHTGGFTIIHYIVEPEHVLPTLVTLFAAIFLVRRLDRKQKKME